MVKEKIGKITWQIPMIVIAAVLISVSVNHWRPDGIPMMGDWSEQTRVADTEGNSLVIGLKDARQLFREHAALFVDARSRSQFAEGHITGAVSLPWQEAETSFMDVADQLDAADRIIIYCDGETCELSHELALFLKEMDFENVRVLVNGWTVWQQAGLPVEAGE